MARIWQNLKAIRKAMKKLNDITNVTEMIHKLRVVLKDMQSQMRDTNVSTEQFDKEKSLKVQLEKWSLIEESIYKHKSRVLNIKLRDSNIAYFFANMKGRKAQNQIKMLTAKNGEMINNTEEIQKEIMGFYKQLLGSASENLPAIHPGVLQHGTRLNRSQQLHLIKPFTKEDVLQALKGIDDMKEPGGDRFNSYFFKKALPTVGDDVTEVVLNYF
ncbi:PREDICTED: uncharacterized protein LOC109237520 [Nicotiana attenuata]|uniref:uncharacterized protein LOC109237520 n=1 Tax=Nicotiana attenuata TaxID=49451 RepID=UPI0009050B9A|nr:PREDICTED: uncharacterized protein LOC109237520 [Nicotiana attenuata]